MAINFSDIDKMTLVNLIAENKADIENKNTDAYSNKRKNEAWVKVTEEYNSSSGTKRSKAQLEGLWKRLKIKARKTISDYQRGLSATGGGPQPEEPDDLLFKVAAVIPGDFEEIHNPYDDDAADSFDKSNENFKIGNSSHITKSKESGIATTDNMSEESGITNR